MPSNEEIAKAITTLTEVIKENPSLAESLRPLTNRGSFGSNYSYYNPKTAEMVKNVIDAMLADPDKLDQKLFLRDFRALSRGSLYVRCWQGFRFLRDKLDPDGIYKEAHKHITMRKSVDGIRFMWKRDVSKIKSMPVQPEQKTKEWKDQFDEFIENAAPGDTFLRKDIEIDNDDREYIKRSLINLPEFKLFKLEKHLVKIAREI